jgi:hypothetical protein
MQLQLEYGNEVPSEIEANVGTMCYETSSAMNTKKDTSIIRVS